VVASWKSGQGAHGPSEATKSESSDLSALGVDFYRFVLDPTYLADSGALWEGAESLSAA
jgi:hypothetical protein